MTTDPDTLVFCNKCGHVGKFSKHPDCGYNPIVVGEKAAKRLAAVFVENLPQDKVRVLRIVEYVGPRNQVEEQVLHSIHGQRKVRDVVIRAATIGSYPEILTSVEPCDLPLWVEQG